MSILALREQGIFSGGIHVMVEEPVSIRRERDMRGTERNQRPPVAARERPDLGGLLVPSADPVSIRFWDDKPGEGQAGNPLQCRRLLSPDVPPNQLVAGFPPEVDRTVIGATKERGPKIGSRKRPEPFNAAGIDRNGEQRFPRLRIVRNTEEIGALRGPHAGHMTAASVNLALLAAGDIAYANHPRI